MCRLVFTLVVAAGVAAPAPAADFPFGMFKKKQRPEAATARAKQLAGTLGSSTDEAARQQAAEGLRGVDPRSNVEVFPALIGALQKDPSPAVRVAAADTLGKLKPVYQPAGMVLDGVAQTDPDPRVREAAQGALFQYHLGGYVTPPGPKASGSAEPPIAPAKPAPTGLTFRPITNTLGRGIFYPPTAEPPLAKLPPAPPGKAAAPAVKSSPVGVPPAPPPAGFPQPMPTTLPPAPTGPAPSVPTTPLPPINVPPPPI